MLNLNTRIEQKNKNTKKFQTDLFWYGFLIAAFQWNLDLYSFLLKDFEET